MKENLLKDRKVFVAAGTSLLGYLVLLYFILYAMGQAGWAPCKLLPILKPGSPLAYLIIADTFFMVLRMFERIFIIGIVYGLPAGLLSIPRLLVGNVINGLAAFRALQAFARSRQGKAPVKWDNTTHLEGVGELPMDPATKQVQEQGLGIGEILRRTASDDALLASQALTMLPSGLWDEDKMALLDRIKELAEHKESMVRANVAKAIGLLKWPENVPTITMLLKDPDWLVSGNAARALLRQEHWKLLLEEIFYQGEERSSTALMRVLEQDALLQADLFPAVADGDLPNFQIAMEQSSMLLNTKFAKWQATVP